MNSRDLGIIVFVAFAASAVLGLCAMADGMTMHDMLCANNTGIVLCSANPLRTATLLVFVGLLVIVAAVLTASPSRTRAVNGTRAFPSDADAPPVIALPLVAAFSDGILNPKAF